MANANLFPRVSPLPGDGKRRDPGNEVGPTPNFSLKVHYLVKHARYEKAVNDHQRTNVYKKYMNNRERKMRLVLRE